MHFVVDYVTLIGNTADGIAHCRYIFNVVLRRHVVRQITLPIPQICLPASFARLNVTDCNIRSIRRHYRHFLIIGSFLLATGFTITSWLEFY